MSVAAPFAIAAQLDAERLALLRTLRGGALLPQLLRTYIHEAARQVAALHAAAASGDTRALASHAHGLKSASFNVGASEMGELCARMEGAGREGDLPRAARLVTALADAFARLLPELERLT